MNLIKEALSLLGYLTMVFACTYLTAIPIALGIHQATKGHPTSAAFYIALGVTTIVSLMTITYTQRRKRESK